MENKIEQNPKHFEITEKLLELVKGEIYEDVENAVKNLMDSLKRRSIIN